MAIFTMEVALLEKESKEMNAEEIDADHTAEASSDSETEQEPMENQAESTVDQEKVDALEEQLTKIQQEKDETYDRMLRIQAEFDNFKRRTKREREADRKRSEEHTSELQSRFDLVCRLLLEKKKITKPAMKSDTK